MQGRATAPGAGTVLNALATGTGSAFAIEEATTASVELDPDRDGVVGEIDGAPDADTRLIERCVELTVERYADLGDSEDAGGAAGAGDLDEAARRQLTDGTLGATVRTESEVPMAAGLKSSSAAANATVLATLSALGVAGPDDPALAAVEDLDRADACRLGVGAARDVGVTVTGAFDDAAASMLGGVVVTDNGEDELLARAERDWSVLVWTPPERAYTADADVERCRKVAPIADLVAELALDGEFGRAMTVNGFAFSAALDFPTDPMLEALPDVEGVSLSGTGPSVVAVGDHETLTEVRDTWTDRDGTTWLTTAQTEGARIEA